MDQYYLQSLELVSLRSVGKSVLVLSEKGPSKIRRGILRFYGTVEFASGQFCGIELDSPQGKHNGSFKGIRYFQCTPDHGIFVPAEKVYNDPKSKNKSNFLPTSIIHKGMVKKAHSDYQIGTSSPRINSDFTHQDMQIPPNSNLFEILNTISSDIPHSNDDKKKLIPKKYSSPKLFSNTLNSKYTPPRQCTSSFPSKLIEPISNKPVPSRPSSVTNASNRNSLSIHSSTSSNPNPISLVRHSSLTEIGENLIQRSVLNDKSPSFQQSTICGNHNISLLTKPIDLSIEECGSETCGIQEQQSSLYHQQDILATCSIPEIPHRFDISFQMNSFFESTHKCNKDVDNASEILQIIDIDKCAWDQEMQIFQKRFLNLKDEVEVLCYQHLEVLSNVPSKQSLNIVELSRQEST